MLDMSRYSMTDRLAAYRVGDGGVARFAIFPVRNTNFVETENQFSRTSLDVFFKILDCSMGKRLWYFQTLLFVRDTFHTDDLVEGMNNKQIPQPRVIRVWNWFRQ
jgi:hypothetical protein